MKNLFFSFVAVLALCVIALATDLQPSPSSVDHAARPTRGVTPWTVLTPTTYWPSDWANGIPPPPQDVVLDTINVPAGGKLTMRMQVAFIVVTQNKWDMFVDGYKVGTGFNVRAGELGVTLCNSMCGGALCGNPTAEAWTPPNPPSPFMLGFPAGSHYYHYVPMGISSVPVTQSVPEGPVPIKGSAYASMETWNGVDNPSESHGYTFEVMVLERAIWNWAPNASLP